MKQFDTVKNNEWVPVEEDLENTIKVVDSLPTASESELGNTYLLNGAMEGYTKTHFYKCLKDETTGLYYWSDLNVGRYSVGNCKSIRLMIIDDGEYMRVLISWRDPDDVIVGSEKIYWQKTVLVHQVGHMPVDMNDGTAILTNTERDKYAVFGSYTFTVTTDNRVHYFKLFPVSEDNAITNDDSNGRRAGYNYQITADTKPNWQDATTYKTYYKRTLDSSTGLTKYVALAYNSDNFGGDSSSGWTFKTTIAYYEYQTSYITWSALQELIQNNEASTYFPIGSVLVLPYHGDFGEMSYEVVDYDGVKLGDSSKNHSMTLQAKYLYTWWDYNGGVVFDTNEKGGVVTTDSGRNSDKTYFLRLGTSSGYTSTAATAVNSTEGSYAIYVESTYDEARRGSYGADAPGIGSCYECELPYVTRYFGGRWTTGTERAIRFPNDCPWTRDGAAATSSNIDDVWASSAFGAVNYCRYQTNDATFKYGKQYWKKTGSTYTALSATSTYTSRDATTYFIGELITDWITDKASGYTIWESASMVHAFGLTSAGNSKEASYVSTVAGRINDPSAACEGWDARAGTWYGTGSPRSNGLAEYFTGVWLLNGSLTYNSQVKYYVPSEKVMSKVRNHAANTTTKLKYYTYRQSYPRCVSDDLKAMYTWLNGLTGTARSTYSKYTTNPTEYAAGDGPVLNLTTVMEDRMPIPTGDERYRANKKYYKAIFSAALSGGTAIGGMLYYKRGGEGTQVNPYIYRRVRLYSGNTIPDGTYSVNFVQMIEGIDYLVGDVIPSQHLGCTLTTGGGVAETSDTEDPTKYYGFAMPFYVMKKKAITGATEITDESVAFDTDPQTLYFWSSNDKLTYTQMLISSSNTTTGYIADGSNTIAAWRSACSLASTSKVYKCSSAYVWTLGDQTSGEYNTCTKDYRGQTPNTTTYVPSNDSATSSNTDHRNPCILVSGIYEAAIGDQCDPVYETTQFKTGSGPYLIHGNRTSQNATVSSNALTFSSSPASGTVQADTLYFTKSGDTYTLVDDGTLVVGETLPADTYYTVTVSVANDATPRTWKEAVASTLKNVVGLDLYRQGGALGWTIFHTKKTAYRYLLWKTPNLERVQYGNHVWAQSNIRMYFNGPFDATTLYQTTVDTLFYSGTTYYMFSAGSGYVAMTANKDYVNGGKIVNGISQSGSSTGKEVYVKCVGGKPVGYKVDKYSPMKYWNYGVSPLQQYRYNSLANDWVTVFDDGDNWWTGQPSINNGLVYDRLAPMFQSGCVTRGVSGSKTKYFTAMTTRTGGGGWGTDVPLDSSSTTNANWSGYDSTTTSKAVSCTANQVMPRQSFLHGFLDCMYKRSTDTTADSSKTYYFRNPYGEYEVQSSSSDVVQHGPYKNCLYEYNTNWLNDISDAKEFLDAIQPVVNRNGCYGTTGAYDFYPQTSTGTTTLDKVWLMSTVQVAGTTSALNTDGTGSGTWYNNGVYENTVKNTLNPQAGDRASSNYKNYPCSLYKYADMVDATAAKPIYGATSLNNGRIKYGYTVGQHSSSGYADVLSGAQYWWLRSAGGNRGPGSEWRYPQYSEYFEVIVTHSGNVPSLLDSWDTREYPNPCVGKGLTIRGLSPLITLG